MNKKLGESKKGLSDVVTTVIIIALSLVAVAVVWVVVQNLISSNTGEIQSSENFLRLKLNIESVSNNSGKLFVLVKRDVGQGNFNAMKFVVVYKNKSSESFIKTGSVDELGVKGFLLNNSGDVGSVANIEAYPALIDDAGKPTVSTIYASYKLSGTINSITCTGSCTGKTCGDDGCGGTCGSCTAGNTCSNGACVSATDPCASMNCNDNSACTIDSCSAGVCSNVLSCQLGQSCVNGACVLPTCTPSCTGKACGASDGCSGICQTGTCVTGTCQSGVCVTVSPGVGTASDPFKITNCVELQNMQNNLTAYYKLMNNIDCSGSVRWNSGDGFIPVGTEPTPFIGKLNGNKFVISNLIIDDYDGDYNGLFGCTNNGFKVYDLGFDRAFIRGRTLNGVLAGRIYGDTVDRVYVKNSLIIANGEYSGGLIGDMRNSVDVHDVYFTGNVTSISNYVGGIVGYTEDSRITNAYAIANLSTTASHVGGIAGRSAGNFNAESLKNVFSVSNLYLGGSWKGGIVSYIDGGSNVIRAYWDNTSIGANPCSNAYAPVSCFAIQDKTYFYNLNNQPLIGFDDTIWQAHADTYPTLTF